MWAHRGFASLAVACLVGFPAWAQTHSGTAASQGIGQALVRGLPSEEGMPLGAQTAGEKDTPWLGVEVSPVPDDARERRDIPAGIGARIEGVEEGSPAAKAKLRVGDIVVQVDSDEVKGVDGLISLVQARKPGQTVKLWFFRDGKKKTASVVLAPLSERTARVERVQPKEEKPKEAPSKEERPAAEPQKSSKPGFLGLQVKALSAERRGELKLGEGEGVEILRVVPDSPAEKIGLKVGDVLLKIGGDSVGEASQLVEKVGSMKAGEETKIVLLRDGERPEMAVKLAARPEPIEVVLTPPTPPTPPAPPAEPKPKPKPKTETPAEPARKGARLGVELASIEMSNELREVLGIEEGEGVRIDRVVDESPAAKGGLQRNDLVLRIDGTKVGSRKAIGDFLGKASAGQTVKMELLRKGKRETVEVTLGERSK